MSGIFIELPKIINGVYNIEVNIQPVSICNIILKHKNILFAVISILFCIYIGLHFFPKKCQEVITLALSGDQLEFHDRQIHCYNIFNKKYWSMEKWSSIVESR